MIDSRITDPGAVSERDIQAIIDQGLSPTVQFSKPCYDRSLLDAVNSLCKVFGSSLEVRFFGHYQHDFDAAVLSAIPSVRWLSVDCLTRILNEDWLHKLPLLERLSFGVFEFDRPDFFDGFQLGQITKLSIAETKSRKLDLGALEKCTSLTELFVRGHTRNIEALSNVPALRKLRLCGMPKQRDLSFVGDIPRLESLVLLLGGRPSFNELRSPTLKELEVIRVRGLETLGPLDRFPNLHRLQIEDQLQLHSFSVAGTQLRELSVHNCKNLQSVFDLGSLLDFEHLRVSRTQLDLEMLRDCNWPPSMKFVALYSSSEKWNEQTRSILECRGYKEFG
jgi:hypothetical protein